MKKLGQMQIKERDKHAQNIRDAQNELNAEIEKYNRDLVVAKEQLESSVTKFNEACDNARTWVAERVSEMESYASERTEKWQEGDAGQEYETWKQEFENLELDDYEVDLPEELSLIEGEERSEALDSLPEAPG